MTMMLGPSKAVLAAREKEEKGSEGRGLGTPLRAPTARRLPRATPDPAGRSPPPPPLRARRAPDAADEALAPDAAASTDATV